MRPLGTFAFCCHSTAAALFFVFVAAYNPYVIAQAVAPAPPAPATSAEAAAASAKDAKAASEIVSQLAKSAKKSATEAVTASGVALNATTNVKDNVRLQAVMLPHDSAARVFGKEIANHYVVVQVIVDNESEDSSFVLQSLFMDYSQWALSGMMQSPEDDADCRRISRLSASQVASCPGQISSIEYRVIRGQLQDAAVWSGRNTVVRAAVFAGSIATGLAGLKSKAALAYSSSYSGDFIPALQIFWPDPTVGQLNRVSDLGFQTNKVFPKGSADVVYAFFPIERFLSPGLKHVFLNAPALFFSPAELFFDPKYENKHWYDRLHKQGLTAEDIDDTKQTIRALMISKEEPSAQSKALGTDAPAQSPALPATSKGGAAKTKLEDQDVLAILMGKCDPSGSTEAKNSCQAQKLFSEISLNKIHVVVGGVMSVNTLTVPASLQQVDFTIGNDSPVLWTKPCTEQSGTITGRFLTDAQATVSKLVFKDGTSKAVADYFDVVPFPADKNATDSDSVLPFTMQLKNAIPLGSTLYFEAIKYAATDSKKANGVKSMEYQFPVTYIVPALKAGETAPAFDKTSCKDRAAATTKPADDGAGK